MCGAPYALTNDDAEFANADGGADEPLVPLKLSGGGRVKGGSRGLGVLG